MNLFFSITIYLTWLRSIANSTPYNLYSLKVTLCLLYFIFVFETLQSLSKVLLKKAAFYENIEDTNSFFEYILFIEEVT